MPWMEVTIPKTDQATKEQLSARLNQQFIEATGFEDEVLYIRFSEFEPGSAGASGRLSKEVETFSHVILYTPRMRFDVKRSVVAGLTSAFDLMKMKPLIHILEFPYDNIGAEGQLLTDADDELASRPYYFVLPR
jgi:phenylpyruvate tautomerase PptA (4-oxalocrotonate tautomerase family)